VPRAVPINTLHIAPNYHLVILNAGDFSYNAPTYFGDHYRLNDQGNNQINTLVLLAHQAYNHLGWIQWAGQMSRMSASSTFGIGYVCVFVSTHNALAYLHLSADRDIVFKRDRALYGRHSLDYIIAIPNHSLQVLSAYLSTHTGPK
jgi:hypothetical protein